MALTRAGGGHVGLNPGEDATHFYILGAIQSNSVSVMGLSKARLAQEECGGRGPGAAASRARLSDVGGDAEVEE